MISDPAKHKLYRSVDHKSLKPYLNENVYNTCQILLTKIKRGKVYVPKLNTPAYASALKLKCCAASLLKEVAVRCPLDLAINYINQDCLNIVILPKENTFVIPLFTHTVCLF